jgi:hypothetical protein
MTISINDYRKHIADAATKASEENVPVHVPVEQNASPDATTGDDHLDKMVRAIQSVIDNLDPVIASVKDKITTAPTNDMIHICLREYWYQKGKQDTLKEIIKLPAQIIMESKS